MKADPSYPLSVRDRCRDKAFTPKASGGWVNSSIPTPSQQCRRSAARRSVPSVHQPGRGAVRPRHPPLSPRVEGGAARSFDDRACGEAASGRTAAKSMLVSSLPDIRFVTDASQ
jgi:hypothetical protein